MSYINVCDGADSDRRALHVRDHNVGDIFHGSELARRADQKLLPAALNVSRAHVGVVPLQRRDKIFQRQLVCGELFGVRSNEILLGEATDSVDFSNTGYVAQLRLDDPVLDNTQVGWRIRGTVFFSRPIFCFDRPQKNLTQACRNRPHQGLYSLGQLLFSGLQALSHQLSGEEQIGAVLKDHGHLRKTRAGKRSCLLEAWEPGHAGFDCKRDTLLGFQRGEAGSRRVDLNLNVCDIGHGINGQFLIARYAKTRHQQNSEHYDNALFDCELNQPFKHRVLLLRGESMGMLGGAFAQLGLENEAASCCDLHPSVQSAENFHIAIVSTASGDGLQAKAFSVTNKN